MAYNYYKMTDAEQINVALNNLPVAQRVDIAEVNDNNEVVGQISHNQAIKVTDAEGKSEYVSFPTNRYVIKQHKEAFRPIVEGLTLAGCHNYKFVMTSNHKTARMQIYATGTGHDSVSIGFCVSNSHDGSSVLSYGFKMSRSVKTLEVVGYRQVCANGMKIKVPLDQAEIIGVETKEKVTELLSRVMKIRHTASMDSKIEEMQYVTEAITLLRDPVEAMIKKAQAWQIKDAKHLDMLIETHVGKRFAKKVAEQYVREDGNSIWQLFNAITHVASHDLKLKGTARENLINKASDMLTAELFPVQQN